MKKSLLYRVNLDHDLKKYHNDLMDTKEPDAQKEQAPWLKRVAQHHTFTIIMAVIAILSVLLSIYLYFVGLKEPQLTYYISPTRTAIVQKEVLQDFSVNFYGNVITNNISAAHIQLWNEGKQAIHSSDILQPITIKLAKNAKLLKSTVTTLRNITINKVATSNVTDAIELNWKTLERNDAINIQIIYEGDVKVPISVTGTVEGQNKIKVSADGQNQPGRSNENQPL